MAKLGKVDPPNPTGSEYKYWAQRGFVKNKSIEDMLVKF